MRTVRAIYQHTSMCPFCESARYLIDMLRRTGIEVVEEMLDAGVKKPSMNMIVLNRKGIPVGEGTWVPCLILEFIEDGEVKHRLIINIEEMVEYEGRRYPCRIPYTHAGALARELLQTHGREIIPILDKMFGEDWRIGLLCLKRYEEIVFKILKIVTAWLRG